MTDSDVANLEAALNARTVAPDLKVVARLFDGDLAERVERIFGIPSALAAPAFAAAALDG